VVGQIVGIVPFAIKFKNLALHLLFKCHFTTRILNAICPWLGRQDIDTSLWENDVSVKDWWTKMASSQGKSMTSMLMLVSWEVPKERNARVFRNHNSSALTIITKIKHY
jgi:hypothetical protein